MGILRHLFIDKLMVNHYNKIIFKIKFYFIFYQYTFISKLIKRKT